MYIRGDGYQLNLLKTTKLFFNTSMSSCLRVYQCRVSIISQLNNNSSKKNVVVDFSSLYWEGSLLDYERFSET